MNKERYIDFDALMAEEEQIPIRFTYRGEDYTLPPEIPAVVGLKILRMKEEAGLEAEVTDAVVMEMVRGLLGETQSKRLFDTGIGITALVRIIRWTMQQYTGKVEPEAEDKPGN